MPVNTTNPRDKALPPLPLGIKRNDTVRCSDQPADIPFDVHRSIELQMSTLYQEIDSFDLVINHKSKFASSYGLPTFKLHIATITDHYKLPQITTPILDAQAYLRAIEASYNSNILRLANSQSPGDLVICERVPSTQMVTNSVRNLQPMYDVMEASERQRMYKGNIPLLGFVDVSPPPYSEIGDTRTL